LGFGHCISRMLKIPFSPRLLKTVQMQGGAPGTHQGWVTADGPFSAAC
jgi:hypothetical protein